MQAHSIRLNESRENTLFTNTFKSKPEPKVPQFFQRHHNHHHQIFAIHILHDFTNSSPNHQGRRRCRLYMEYALEQAQKSPPKPANYRVGAILLDADTNTTIATGYTLELPGNTHAEQTCFMKVAEQHNLPEEKIGEILPKNTVLYTTVEPCKKRLSGNLTCVERILRLGNAVKVVYVGVKEPEKFVGQNLGRAKLENAGIKVEHVEVEGMEKRILEISTAGQTKDE